MDDKTLLLTHMEDLARRAQRVGWAAGKFLTPGQAAQVEQAFGTRRDVALALDGGFAGAERQVAIFTQPDWGSYDRGEVLAALRLGYRPQDSLRHQDILGAILGLGLSREVLGDISAGAGQAFVVCLAPMADFIADELKQAGRVGLSAGRLPLEELPDLAPQLQEKTVSVASLRLDAVVAAAFNWPRTQAAEAILAGRVSLAHQPCENVSRPVEPGQVFSVRGAGRVKLLRAEGTTRKGRQRVVLGYYQ